MKLYFAGGKAKWEMEKVLPIQKTDVISTRTLTNQQEEDASMERT